MESTIRHRLSVTTSHPATPLSPPRAKENEPPPALPPVNRERMADFFMKLAAVPGVSGNERAVADFLKEEVRTMGYEVTEDDAGTSFGGNTGNLLFTVPGNVPAPPITLLAHMDTVDLAEGVEPIREEDIIRPKGRTALGGDDRAGVSNILEALRILKEQSLPHGEIQVIFTAAEEAGLLGSQYLPREAIRGAFGFAADSFKAHEIYFAGGEPLVVPQDRLSNGAEHPHVRAEKAFKRPVSTDDFRGLTRQELDLLEFTKGAIRSIGLEPEYRRVWGASDALSLREKGVPAITVGAGEENIHSRRELVRVSEMERCTQLLLAIITGMTGVPIPPVPLPADSRS